jgi:diadenosine tetraphosphate (Ap4A) HIT family hydrolase
MTAACELCSTPGGELIFQNGALRVVLVDDSDYPGFTRVVWQTHVKEMTDLEPLDRQSMLKTVMLVEQLQRDVLKPDKINLASLGNMTPHLHWHVIPRWATDPTFPQPIWANKPLRIASRPLVRTEHLVVYRQGLADALASLTG